MVRMSRSTMPEIMPARFAAAACLALLYLGISAPAVWCAKKPSRPVTTADGRPIRTIYIRSASTDSASSAVVRLAQDTCLTAIADPKQADAVLELGVVLPTAGGGIPTPNVFGPSARRQTVGNSQSGTGRSASATCSDSKGSGGCTSSYNAAAGDVAAQPPPGWPGNAGGNLDISLMLPGNGSPELWEPDPHSKKSWSDQLRTAAGCPVCPGEHLDRHKYKTYRNWIQTECPAVLTASETQ